MNQRQTMKRTRTLEDVLITNWAVYTCTHFQIRNSALITGANESGKSTIIDALTYAMFGITDFNIQAGAGEDERSVIAYVKGDTKDNEDRFLRGDQDVTSYIAVDLYNPADGTYLTEGVCIELYKGDTQTRSRWFVVPGAKISDINFYTKNGNTVSFTARQDLRFRGKPLNFYKREEGIAVFLRMSGLRLGQGGVRELRGKVRRLLACGKKKMDIDRFVRESIFEEDKTAQNSLDNILQHKAEFEKLAEDLRKLNEEKELLQRIEEQYLRVLKLDAEAVRRSIAQKKFLYMRQKQADDGLETDISDLKSRMRVLEKKETQAQKLFDAADTEFIRASTAMHEGQRPVEELKDKLRRDEESRIAMEDSIRALRGLKKKAETLFGGQDDLSVSDELYEVISHAGEASADEAEIIRALQELEHKREAMHRNFQRRKEETGYALRDVRRELERLNREIRTLQQNKKVLPDGMEEELAVLKKEAERAGIHTELRFLCDLVNEIDPKWQTAAETFLGGRRFNVIAEPQAVPRLLRIVDEKNLYKIYLVLTNRMDDIPSKAPEGSLAARFQAANLYARKYINYTCGNLKCVETRQELNDNPRGAITPGGMLARGIVGSKMKPVRDLVFGKDAVLQLLEKKKKERDEKQAKETSLKERADRFAGLAKRAYETSFAPEYYDTTAPLMLLKLREEIAETKRNIRALENNPSAKRLLDMYLAASEKREQAQKNLTDIQSERKSDARSMQERSEKLRDGRRSEQALREAYETAAALHPEEKTAADALYEKQKNNAEGSLQRAIQEVNKQLGEATNGMLEAMFRYNATHAGYVADKSGAKNYIARLDELRTKDIEETRNKIEAKARTISDTFMRDFVEVIYSRIRSMRDQKDAINAMLKAHKFGDKNYSLIMKARSSADMKAFFAVAQKIDELGSADNLELYLNMNSNFLREQGIADAFETFRDTVLNADDVTEYTDYRNYYTYDFFINDGQHTAYLSRSQGIYSGGGKQTPYFILLTAALMTSYRSDTCCLRIAFIDEAFAAMDEDRIRSMIDYFNDNGLQVIYAAPDKTMHNIAPYVDTTVTVVKKNRKAEVIDMQAGITE
ncbi:MAG: hypothetical protein LKG40_02420 [Lachnospiraceae bacterium]|jgi:uncharacterized protein YPO0396|nr:hypothetical protein [Lachnospiraceae bacterium]MCI1329047.1 hypothetical protein [Lachnospiraceae bacterium]